MAVDKKEKLNIQADLLFCLFLIGLLAIFFIEAFGYRPVTRRAPLVVMIPLAFMLLGQLLILIKKYRQIRAENPETSLIPKIERESMRKATVLLAWMILLMLMIYVLGQLFAIGLFLVIFLKFTSHESWAISISLGICVTLGLYLLFEVVLKIMLYPGAIYTYLSGLIGT